MNNFGDQMDQFDVYKINTSNDVKTHLSYYYDKSRKKSTFSDIRVNVESDVYRLNRVILALKSNHLENILLQDVKSTQLEITSVASDTFSAIVRLMYGETQQKVIDEVNFASVLIAMHHLKMEIDLKSFLDFIKSLKNPSTLDNMYTLYDFVQKHSNFNHLMPTLRQYFSDNLTASSAKPEFLDIPKAELLKILVHQRSQFQSQRDECLSYSEICARWISKSPRSRSNYIVEIANAVKYRLGFSYKIINEIVNLEIVDNVDDDDKLRENLQKYFYKLLTYYGEVDAGTSILHHKVPDEVIKPINKINEIDEQLKWSTYLSQGRFSDITVTIRNKTYKLHRIKLSLSTRYFDRYLQLLEEAPSQHLCIPSTDRLNVQDTSQPAHSKDTTAFEVALRYIYCGNFELPKTLPLTSLIETCELLGIPGLIEKIDSYVKGNIDAISGNVFHLLWFLRKRRNLKKFTCYDGILESITCQWPNIDKIPHFREISLCMLEYLLHLTYPRLKIYDGDEILRICSIWIAHDVKSRYMHVPEIASAINRNFCWSEQVDLSMDDSNTYNETRIKNDLVKILSSNALLPPTNPDLRLRDQKKPFFVILKETTLSVVNAQFSDIVTIPNPPELVQSSDILPAATLVNDNLFLTIPLNPSRTIFLVFNHTSKKFIQLEEIKAPSDDPPTLLNSNNDVFYFNSTQLLKYSMLVNRWICLDDFAKKSLLASDATALFRLFLSDSDTYKLHRYHSHQKSWIALSSLSRSQFPDTGKTGFKALKAAVINENLCVLFARCTAMFNLETHQWHVTDCTDRALDDFAQYKRDILYITKDREVYSYSPTVHQWKKIREFGPDWQRVVVVRSIDD